MPSPRPSIPALLAILLMVSGCAGNGGATQEALPATEGVDRVGGNELDTSEAPAVNETAVVLVVHVLDRDEQPIPNAFVVLVNTQHSGPTNTTGAVRFGDLEPGPYHLRIDAEFFRSLEANLTLKAGVVTEVRFKLTPVEGLVEGGAGHFHDYWLGQKEVTLFEDVRWDITCVVYQYPCVINGQPKYGYHGFPHWPAGALVFPGAGTFELTLKWSGTNPVAVGMYVVKPTATSQKLEKAIFSQSGQTFSLSIDQTNTDRPHAKTTRWYLYLDTQATNHYGAWMGPFFLTVKIKRGDYPLPYDPPHPDFWGEKRLIRMVESNFTWGYVQAVGNVYASTPGSSPAPYNANRFPAGKLVYPGAGALVVRAWVNETLAPKPLQFQFEVNDFAGSSGAPIPQHHRNPTVDQRNYKEWRIDIDPAWWDDVYVSLSKWAWRLRPEGAAPGLADNHAYVGDVHLVMDLQRLAS